LSGNHLRSLASPRLTSAAVVDYPLQTFAAEGDRKDVASTLASLPGAVQCVASCWVR